MEMIWDLLLKANLFCTGDHFTQPSAQLTCSKTEASFHAPSFRVQSGFWPMAEVTMGLEQEAQVLSFRLYGFWSHQFLALFLYCLSCGKIIDVDTRFIYAATHPEAQTTWHCWALCGKYAFSLLACRYTEVSRWKLSGLYSQLWSLAWNPEALK